MRSITNLDHPFQVGVKVAVRKYWKSNYTGTVILTVTKAYKNGLVRVADWSANLRPAQAADGTWTLERTGDRVWASTYRKYDLLTDKLAQQIAAELDAAQKLSCMMAVRAHIKERLANDDVKLSADQLARINGILNESH